MLPDAQRRLLMCASQDGDAESYQALLTDLCLELRTFFNRHLADDAVAEKLTGDVLWTIHRYRSTYRPEQSVAGWVAAIAQHRLAVHLWGKENSAAARVKQRAWRRLLH